MQSLDYNILFLILIHFIETGIIITYLLKVLFQEKTIDIIFFIKTMVLTCLILSFVYLGYYLFELIKSHIFDFWLRSVYPFLILLLTFYYLKFLFNDQKYFKNYFRDKMLFVSIIILFIIFLQVAIFIQDHNPTLIIVVRSFVPLN